MGVVISEFEVVPDARQPDRPRGEAQAAPQQDPKRTAREVEATVRILLARRARLRAT